MLVLSRKKNESVIAYPPGGGPDGTLGKIEVMVIEIRGDKVRLGFVAPKKWAVHRREVYDAIHPKPPASEQEGSPGAASPP